MDLDDEYLFASNSSSDDSNASDAAAAWKICNLLDSLDEFDIACLEQIQKKRKRNNEERAERRQQLAEMDTYTDEEYRRLYRVSRPLFYQILEKISPRLQRDVVMARPLRLRNSFTTERIFTQSLLKYLWIRLRVYGLWKPVVQAPRMTVLVCETANFSNGLKAVKCLLDSTTIWTKRTKAWHPMCLLVRGQNALLIQWTRPFMMIAAIWQSAVITCSKLLKGPAVNAPSV
jgi:hypothetical protein